MSSETGDPRPVRLSTMAARPQEPEHLPCPRCDSANTKFCYYNNYNLSQPRHFCKSCRRYWTRGGTLRNVPVGGGSRKTSTVSSSSSSSSSNKRPRTTSATTSPTATTPTASSSSDNNMTRHDPQLHADPVSMVHQMGAGSGPLMGCEVNLNEAVPEASNFSSLLTMPFGGGFGLGIGPGLHGFGFGLGPMDWPMEPVDQGNGGVGELVGGDDNGSSAAAAAGAGGSSSSGGCNNNTWQIGGGVDGSLSDGDCFGWPDLAISMPGKGLK